MSVAVSPRVVGNIVHSQANSLRTTPTTGLDPDLAALLDGDAKLAAILEIRRRALCRCSRSLSTFHESDSRRSFSASDARRVNPPTPDISEVEKFATRGRETFMEHRYSDLRHVETADALDARNIALAELRAVELYSKTHGGSSFEVRWTGGRAGSGAPIVSPAPTRIADARAKLAALLK